MRRLTRSFVKMAVPVVAGGLVAASAGLALADDNEQAQARGPAVALELCDKNRGPYTVYIEGAGVNGEKLKASHPINEKFYRCWFTAQPNNNTVPFLWSTLTPPTLRYEYASPEQPPISFVCEAVRNAKNGSTVPCHAPNPEAVAPIL